MNGPIAHDSIVGALRSAAHRCVDRAGGAPRDRRGICGGGAATRQRVRPAIPGAGSRRVRPTRRRPRMSPTSASASGTAPRVSRRELPASRLRGTQWRSSAKCSWSPKHAAPVMRPRATLRRTDPRRRARLCFVVSGRRRLASRGLLQQHLERGRRLLNALRPPASPPCTREFTLRGLGLRCNLCRRVRRRWSGTMTSRPTAWVLTAHRKGANVRTLY